MLKIFIFLLPLSFVFSCSENKKESSKRSALIVPVVIPEDDGPFPRPGDGDLPDDPASDSNLSRLQNIVQLECRGECEESVGFIVGLLDSGDTYVCTGSLVGENVLLTNSHCIPEDLKNNPKIPCTDRISVTFGETQSHPKELAYCAEILFASDISQGPVGTSPDYAFITLNHLLKRKFNKIERSEIDPKKGFKFAKVNPDLNAKGVFGTMETLENCRPVMDTFIAPNFVDAFFPIASMFGCPIEQGNSGGPVFNDQGNVVGVIFAGTPDNVVQDLLQYGPTIDPSVSLVTSFACLENEYLPKKIDGRCAGLEARTVAAIEQSKQKFNESLQEAQAQIYDELLNTEFEQSAISPAIDDKKLEISQDGLEYNEKWELSGHCVENNIMEYFSSWEGEIPTNVHVKHKISLDRFWRPSIDGQNSRYFANNFLTAKVRKIYGSQRARFEYKVGDSSQVWRGILGCSSRSRSHFSIGFDYHKIIGTGNRAITSKLRSLLVY